MTQTILPGPRTGTIRIPASKSQAHRMLICAALSQTPSRLILDGFSADIDATIRCLEALGTRFVKERGGISVVPLRTLPAHAAMDAGESGSTLRFLLPVLGALGVQSEIRMHGRLPARPLSPLWELLEAHGMSLRKDGSVLRTGGQLSAGAYCLPGNVSSQFVSGLLFALPLLRAKSTLTVTGPLQSARYVAMTEQALAASGIHTGKDGQCWYIAGGQRYAVPAVQNVEGDWSNAAFFLCMGALSDRGVTVTGLNLSSLQADRAILDILEKLGASLTVSGDTVTVKRGGLCGITLDAGPIPDLIPVVSCLAAFCAGETRIENAARLRLKESDRLQTTAAMITDLGGCVQERPDGLIITGSPVLRGGSVDACGDHRIAMSAAMAACGCAEQVSVCGSECVSKSYPAFWEDFTSLKEDAI